MAHPWFDIGLILFGCMVIAIGIIIINVTVR